MTTDAPAQAPDLDRAAEVGAVIRRRREARGISLRAFAAQCELSPAHVSKIERGLASPSLVTLTQIVQELDLHGADLFGLAQRLPGHPQVIRAAEVPVLPVEDTQTGDAAVRVAAQTPAATVLVGLGGPDHYLPPTVSTRQVIALVLEGAAEAHVGDEVIALEAGDTLIIPPLAPHGIRITGGPGTRTVYITSDDSRMVFEGRRSRRRVTDAGRRAATGTGLVLATLAAGQFVMALDTTVMNTAIATVAKDLGTTVTGIQTAITLYTLVMASLMITGGKVGEIVGRKRAFTIGCAIYACGSLTTALAPNLTVLMIGWSGLEGLGAVLIMPAVVALVASNFGKSERPRAYGLIAAAGAIAAALGPLIGGLFTTYWSWRYVFAGEVVIVAAILLFARRVADTPPEEGVQLDLFGTLLSALGLGLIVLGILKSGTWGVVQPKPEAPQWLGLSPVIWMVIAGAVALALFVRWEARRLRRGEGALLDPQLLRNLQLRAGVVSFFFMQLVLAGTFFVVPLFLSVALGLSAIATGVRLLPLSLTLLLFAAGVPRAMPDANPRRVVNVGFIALFAGLVLLIGLLEVGAGPEIITWPLLLIGSGIGAMASQLGSVTVSAVPDEQSGEVGGLQNTGTQLGASIGTALAGAILISALTASFFTGIQNNPAIPDTLATSAQTELAAGVPFVSDKDLEQGLEAAGVSQEVATAAVDENAQARIAGLRSALAVLALIALLALAFTRRLPVVQPGSEAQPGAPPAAA